MKRTEQKRRIAGALALVTVSGALMAVLTGINQAYAVTSLPHIEEIVTNLQIPSTEYNILEIVPQAGSGSIGYYVGGQEPTAGWQTKLSTLETQDARSNYANTLLDNLKNSGLMSDTADAAPLHSLGEYQEVYPWARSASASYAPLTLGEAQTESVAGSMIPDTTNGAYTATTRNTIDPAGTGTQVQNILYFEKSTETFEGEYCYNPEFKELTEPIADTLPDDTALYVNTGTAEAPVYQYERPLLGYDMETTYYYVAATGAPSETCTGEYSYAAVVNSVQPFRDKTDAEPGYFNTVITGYIYQGDGAGAYRFVSDGSGSISITTSTVYYTGGYENNNWFITKILDRQTSEVAALRGKIKVKSLQPDQVTTIDVQDANLIVLSNGYYYNNETIAGDAVSVYTADNTLISAVADAIAEKTGEKQNAVIVDRALAAERQVPITMETLAKALIGEKTGSLVNENVFVLDSTDSSITSAHYPLATKDLGKPFEPATVYTASDGAFYAIYAETTHENFLRQTEDAETDDLLATDVSMAQCIRYVINFAGQRSAVQRHALTVLDIEPDSKTSLTADMVRSWYPAGTLTGEDENGDGTVSSTERNNAIQIFTMSTTEFVGKMEDVSETYDVVYIGDTTGDFTEYYKNNENPSQCYTNIGEAVNIGSYKMSGMLDSDYYHSLYYTEGWGSSSKHNDFPLLQNEDTTTFRYSGNDLTAKNVQALQEFAAAGHTVILADNLLGDTSWYADSFTLTASLNCAKNDPTVNGLTAQPALVSNTIGLAADDADVTYTYQWYQLYNNSSSAIAGQTAQTLPASALAANSSYYCAVTAVYHETTFSARTETARLGSSAKLTVNGQTSGQISGDINITISSISENNGRVQLLPGSRGNSGNVWSPTTNLTMSNNNSRATIDTSSWAAGSSITYQFTATNRQGNWFQGYIYTETMSAPCVVTKSLTVAAIDTITKASATQETPTRAGERTVNTSYVDGASQMYQFINTIKDRTNVLPQSATVLNKALTYEYLNLSRPQLRLTEQPPEYDESSKDSDVYNIDELSYTFQIINTTDPTPVTTTYQLDFYLDTDANGYFASGESIGDIVCLDANGNQVEPNVLQGGVNKDLAPTYTIKRSLPSDMAGYLSWKLQVVKNGEDNQYVHASQTGNAYVKTAENTKTTITVLQVDSAYDGYAKGDQRGYNLENSVTYQTLLSSKTVTDDFNVRVYTIYTEDLTTLYQYAGYANWTDEWKNYFNGRQTKRNGQYNSTATAVYDYLYGTSGVFDAAKAGTTPRARLSYLLKLFDMMILGFGDCYYDLGQNDTALSVADYINAGLPTLMAHDTTSFYNVPDDDYDIVNAYGSVTSNFPDDAYFWGYGFNTVLRSLVSMDRYGVADENYGRSMYSSAYSGMTSSGLVASAYSGLSSTIKDALTADGYSVAYEPTAETPIADGSNLKTVSKTQGFTNYALEAQHQTTTVTQVNKGQITSYPFNINTDDFDSTNTAVGATITVASTHQQYYQINMNKGDIAVWYCLSGSDYQKNDAANGYYIYTVGNVTYTGAGHSSTEADVSNSSNLNEAKLFVNTMIAAYRTERTAPTIDLYNSNTADSALTSYPLTADYEGAGYAAGLVEKSADCPVYFAIKDTNLDGSRVNRISLSYQNPVTGENVTGETVQVKRADASSGNVNNTSLISSRVYYFNLPQELLNAFGDAKNVSNLEITVHVSTIFFNRDGTTTDPADYETTSTINLFKLGLLDLS